MYPANKGDMYRYSDNKYQQHCFVAALLMPAIFFVLVFFSEEPLSLLDGTSMWPAEFLKMLALWLSYFLFYHGSHMVVMGRKKKYFWMMITMIARQRKQRLVSCISMKRKFRNSGKVPFCPLPSSPG